MSAPARAWLRRHHCYVDSEAGDTLIEVLLAVVILSLAVVALMGALVTSIASSAEHRSLSDIDSVLKGYAENAKYDIELQGSPAYAPCASVTSTTYNGAVIDQPTLPPAPPTWSPPYIVKIQYWNNATAAYDTSASCVSTDYEFLTLGATAPNGVSKTLTIGLRSPT